MVSYFDLPLADKRRLDAVCVAFEEAGHDSKIEDYLSHCEQSLRGTLLTELLAMELERQRVDAGGGALNDYLARFPSFPESVREAFGTRMPAIGSTLGKYKLTGILGHGGMGIVFDAIDTVIGRSVAIKVLPPRLMQEADSRQRLLSEARLAGQVQHPNVVTLYELGEADGTAFLVMERVSGGTAAQRIRRDGPYDWQTATRIMTDVVRGLCAVHDAGFLHLDIKPGNVLLMQNPSSGAAIAKLSDFSLSMSDATTPGLTLAAGTPAYMSPEQRSSGPLTPQTDVFGFGATFFALLTGRAPYEGGDVTTILAEQVREPHPDPRAVNPQIPEAIAKIVRQSMATAPEDRQESAAELLTQLEEALTPPRVRRRRDVVAVCAGALVMLAIAVGITIMLTSPKRSPLTNRLIPDGLDRVDAWEPLLDGMDMAEWKKIVPEGGTPIGVGPQSQFEMVMIDKSPVLRATGTGLGSVESEREYDNYHLRFEYRWSQAAGDHYASVRYHCTGPFGSSPTHGMQLTMDRAGSYIRLNDRLRFDLGRFDGDRIVSAGPGDPRMEALGDFDAPVGRWNRADLICVGDSAVHVINGTPTLILTRSRRVDPPDEPLTRGRLRFQSIKGEIYFSKIEIRRVTEVPAEFRLASGGR